MWDYELLLSPVTRAHCRGCGYGYCYFVEEVDGCYPSAQDSARYVVAMHRPDCFLPGAVGCGSLLPRKPFELPMKLSLLLVQKRSRLSLVVQMMKQMVERMGEPMVELVDDQWRQDECSASLVMAGLPQLMPPSLRSDQPCENDDGQRVHDRLIQRHDLVAGSSVLVAMPKMVRQGQHC